MDADFWHERWRNEQIGFHQRETNKLLMKHWPAVAPDPRSEVFVPLCGKSLDMTWLSERGHRVIGVELSGRAARDYFAGRAITPDISRNGTFEVISGGGVEIWVGDFFELPPSVLGSVSAAYDRASLIALPADMRDRYAARLVEILPAPATTMLLTITYDQSKMSGPPFSIDDNEVERLFAGAGPVNRIETRDAMAGSDNLRDRGLDHLTTSVFFIGPRSSR